MDQDKFDTRTILPAHIPVNTSAYDPYQFDATNHSFVSKIAVAILLLGIVAIIAQIVS